MLNFRVYAAATTLPWLMPYSGPPMASEEERLDYRAAADRLELLCRELSELAGDPDAAAVTDIQRERLRSVGHLADVIIRRANGEPEPERLDPERIRMRMSRLTFRTRMNCRRCASSYVDLSRGCPFCYRYYTYEGTRGGRLRGAPIAQGCRLRPAETKPSSLPGKCPRRVEAVALRRATMRDVSSDVREGKRRSSAPGWTRTRRRRTRRHR